MADQLSIRDYKAEVTAKILAALEGGKIPWNKPWVSRLHDGAPFNGLTNKPYNGGVNTILLWLSAAANGWNDPRWAGRGQLRDNHVKIVGLKDGVATTIYAPIFKKAKDEETGTLKSVLVGFRPVQVFNFAQVDDPDLATLDSLRSPEVDPAENHKAAAALVASTGAHIKHGGNRAAYSPMSDQIMMPNPGDFNSTENYWSTLLHEVIHWTGHESRLNRPFSRSPEAYAFEELVAEMGSAFSCARVGIEREEITLGHAGYIQHWIQILKGDSDAFTRAAGQAWKAHQFIVGESKDSE